MLTQRNAAQDIRPCRPSTQKQSLSEVAHATMRSQQTRALAVAAAAGTLALLAARKRGISLSKWLQIQAEVAGLIVEGASKDQNWRWRKLRELLFLASLERARRLEQAEADARAPGDPDAVYRLHPLAHVTTQRQLASTSIKTMMDRRMTADAAPVVTDLVLVGGGHAHVHVLRMLGMQPLPGVRITLVTRDVETPYSGMLPGHVAGVYSRREAHIDLNKLARVARARLIAGEVVDIDAHQKVLHLKDGRPPLPYDVLSVNVGIAPSKPVAYVTPVKPIAHFSAAWDALLARLDDQSVFRLVVVGGGAGGVELILAMVSRVSSELRKRGRDPATALHATLVARSSELVRAHAPGARKLLTEAVKRKGVRILLAHEAVETANVKGEKVLRCSHKGSIVEVPFDECAWCTQAAAAPFLKRSGLDCDAGGFLRTNLRLQCLMDNEPTRVYAAGDCASVDGHIRPKAGVFAVMAGMALYQNLVADLEGSSFVDHVPQERLLALISAGDGTCVASRGDFTLEAAWLWSLKDWIDRKWMWQYTGGLPSLEEADEDVTDAVAIKANSQDVLRRNPMRCGGCGAKVGASTLKRALDSLPPVVDMERCVVEVGLDAPDDGAVVKYGETRLVHTVDFFRSFVGDPYVFGQIAANHSLSDCDAMGALPATALALCVVPYGGERQTEDSLRQMMAGARLALDAAGCALVGGHTCEGAELALGFAINGTVTDVLAKGGLRKGDALVLTKPLGTGVVFAGDMRALADASDVSDALTSMCRSNAHAAATLRRFGCVACTDVTGFGLIGHLAELCRGSDGAKVRIDLDDVPMLAGALRLAASGVYSSLQPENLRARRAVANHARCVEGGGFNYELLYDPQTAGGLLAAVPAAKAAACVAALRDGGDARAAVVGAVLSSEDAPAFSVEIEVNF